jgi:hypothetical protein
LPCFFCQIKRTNACSSQISGSERPDLQAKSALAAGWSSHCLTAPHSSNHKGSQMLLCIATSESQKCNLNNIFYKSKGHFATGKRALSAFSENFGGGCLPPPPFLRPRHPVLHYFYSV